jgi:recombinational DNA repair protein (RecF pathway)
LCSFYLNELLLKLLPRGILTRSCSVSTNPHWPASRMARAGAMLRQFEVRLLAELGYRCR